MPTTPIEPEDVRSAAVVLPAGDLDATLAFFTERLGLRLESIFPADAPRVALLTGHGLRLRLDRSACGDGGRLVVDAGAHASGELVAPNGTVVEFVHRPDTVPVPPLSGAFVHRRAVDIEWSVGRAGMRYGDLLPGRVGGALIASRIEVPGGGPVPDWVHYHRVGFQLIYCLRGSARLVYEDQGEPFDLRAGDAVLQPPTIRHRVLATADDLAVCELSAPAEHETLADHDLALPTGRHRPERDFGGQRFVHHVARGAASVPWRADGFRARDLGLDAATHGLASGRVVRAIAPGASAPPAAHDGAAFWHVVAGGATVGLDAGAPRALAAGDSLLVPAGRALGVEAATADLELLEVVLRPAPTARR